MKNAQRKNLSRIIVDTDPGHDDALALLLLERSRNVNIEAVTTVAGNSTIQNTTNNARYILNLAESKAPLYSGTAKPLRRKLIQAVVHGASGLAGIKIKRSVKLTCDAPDKIASIVRRYPNQITVLVLGPETNLAKAFLKDPQLPRLVKEVVIMGGAITVPGNKNRVAEFNIFVDPEAARIVFDAPVRKVLIPLDVCNDVALQLKEFELLRGTTLYKPVIQMMNQYIGGIARQEKTRGAIMYDPLAAYYLLNPAAYTLVPMDVRVETEGALTRGMTVAERRIWGKRKNNVEVAVAVDRKKFIADFFRILKNPSATE